MLLSAVLVRRFIAPCKALVAALLVLSAGCGSDPTPECAFFCESDEFADSVEGAVPLPEGAEVSGGLQFNGDVDVHALDLEASTSSSIEAFVGSFNGAMLLELLAPDGTTLLAQSQETSTNLPIHASTAGRYFLRIRAVDPAELLTYTLRLQRLGPDDHGNTPAQASPLLSNEASGGIQYEKDVDVFSAPTTAGHIYRATVNPSLTLRSLALTVTADGRALGQGYLFLEPPVTVLFKAATASTILTVWSNSFPNSLGTYSLSLEDVGLDDHGDTPETATPMTLPGAINGTLGFSGDVDVFSFAATVGRIYRFRCGSNPIELLARDGAGKTVATGRSGTLLYEATASAPVSVEVSHGSGAYGCTLEDVGTDDLPDTSVGAPELSVPPASGTGNLETWTDVDVFTFRPTAGRVYRFSCEKLTCGVRLRGADGAVLAEGLRSSSGGGYLAWEATAMQTASVEVFASPQVFAEPMVGTYSYLLEDVGTDDHGDTAASATALGQGTVQVGGSFESFGDVDTFTFPATAGHIYRVTCAPGPGETCTTRVKDPGSQALTPPFEARAGGLHLVEVSLGMATGTYTLYVVDLGPDDHADTASGATAITPGGAALTGRLETFDDVDTFSFSATARNIYRLECKADVSLASCRVRVRDASGTLVVSTDSPPGLVPFEAPRTGTLTVELSPAYLQHAGTYSLTLEDRGPDDYGNTPATAHPLALATPLEGRFQASSDVDVFAVSLTAGWPYQVSLTSEFSVQFSVLDASGGIIAQGSNYSFTAPATGTYYVRLASWADSGSYTLRVNLR